MSYDVSPTHPNYIIKWLLTRLYSRLEIVCRSANWWEHTWQQSQQGTSRQSLSRSLETSAFPITPTATCPHFWSMATETSRDNSWVPHNSVDSTWSQKVLFFNSFCVVFGIQQFLALFEIVALCKPIVAFILIHFPFNWRARSFVSFVSMVIDIEAYLRRVGAIKIPESKGSKSEEVNHQQAYKRHNFNSSCRSQILVVVFLLQESNPALRNPLPTHVLINGHLFIWPSSIGQEVIDPQFSSSSSQWRRRVWKRWLLDLLSLPSLISKTLLFKRNTRKSLTV